MVLGSSPSGPTSTSAQLRMQLGIFFVGPRVHKGSCGFLRTLDSQYGTRKTPILCLSRPFFSPGSLSRNGRKSAKGLVQSHKNQQLTSGRIKQLFFGIGRGRKPPRFREWRMQASPTNGRAAPGQERSHQRSLHSCHWPCLISELGGRIISPSHPTQLGHHACQFTVPLCHHYEGRGIP